MIKIGSRNHLPSMEAALFINVILWQFACKHIMLLLLSQAYTQSSGIILIAGGYEWKGA